MFFDFSMLSIELFVEANVKILPQQLSQTISVFFRELRVFARNAYLVEAVRNEIQLTTPCGDVQSVVRSRVRRSKLADEDAALQAAVKLQSFHETDGLRVQTSGVKNICPDNTFDTFAEIFPTLCRESQDSVAHSSRSDKSANVYDQKNCSDSQNSSRWWSSLRGRGWNNIFSNFRKSNQTNERNTARSTTSGKTPEFVFQKKTNNKRRDWSSISQRSNDKNANINAEAETFIPAMTAQHASNVIKGTFQAPMQCLKSISKLKAPVCQRGNCAETLKNVQQMKCLNSVVDDTKSSYRLRSVRFSWMPLVTQAPVFVVWVPKCFLFSSNDTIISWTMF